MSNLLSLISNLREAFHTDKKEHERYVQGDETSFTEFCLKYFEEELKLSVKVSEFGHILLDYSQIDSPRKHPVVDECRGIILDPSLTSIVCRPFNRFYNVGEYPELEATFDFKNCYVDEKADGSLIKMWYDCINEKWQVGTRGSFFGDNKISTLTGEEGTISFKELFLRATNQTQEGFEKWSSLLNKDTTFLFELCTLENKIVTAYPKDTVFLLGARNNVTGAESNRQTLDDLQAVINQHLLSTGSKAVVLRPHKYFLRSLQEIKESAEKLEGMKEGFVLCDDQFNRLKMKSTAYVQAHHIRGEGVTPKRAVLLALSGEIPEFLAYFPEFSEILTPYDQHVNSLKEEIVETFSKIKGIEGQKEFALEAMKYKYNGFLFSLRKGISLQEAISKSTTNNLISVFHP